MINYKQLLNVLSSGRVVESHSQHRIGLDNLKTAVSSLKSSSVSTIYIFETDEVWFKIKNTWRSGGFALMKIDCIYIKETKKNNLNNGGVLWKFSVWCKNQIRQTIIKNSRKHVIVLLLSRATLTESRHHMINYNYRIILMLFLIPTFSLMIIAFFYSD